MVLVKTSVSYISIIYFPKINLNISSLPTCLKRPPLPSWLFQTKFGNIHSCLGRGHQLVGRPTTQWTKLYIGSPVSAVFHISNIISVAIVTCYFSNIHPFLWNKVNNSNIINTLCYFCITNLLGSISVLFVDIYQHCWKSNSIYSNVQYKRKVIPIKEVFHSVHVYLI
jgi:hypothetical protein